MRVEESRPRHLESSVKGAFELDGEEGGEGVGSAKKAHNGHCRWIPRSEQVRRAYGANAPRKPTTKTRDPLVGLARETV